MAEENQRLPSRQQIFAIGMVLVLIPGVLFLSTQGSGGGGADLQNTTAGNATFTTTQGTLFYSQSITFSPALKASPCQGCVQLSVLGNPPLVSVPAINVVFLADGASTQTDGTWTGMPAATTELFGPGTTSHLCCRVAATVTGLTSCVLSVSILVYSNTAGATLAVQFSTSQSQAGPWSTIAGSSVDVNAIANLPKLSNNFTPNTGHQGVDLFRIVGAGGGGLGDNPQFGNISMSCEFTFGGIAHPSYFAATATGMTLVLQMTVPDPNIGDSIIISFSAYICTSGTNPPC